MYDSSAKLPSGLLNGNINQFGDFDECLNVRDAANDITGKYCLAHIQIHVSDKWARMEQIRKLIQSHDAFVSEFNDVSFIFMRSIFIVVCWGNKEGLHRN